MHIQVLLFNANGDRNGESGPTGNLIPHVPGIEAEDLTRRKGRA